ncbi:hypothetical protein [Streptomyces sp. NPDC020330]|uniref:hypothetical protein n=1 Tax=unclassified Streptomyces TaxID=2593676 RepID=UPI0037B85616
MSANFPGHRPLTGDTVYITAGSRDMTMRGEIVCVGILRDGCGLAELTLPDADPQQRRELERCERYQYDLLVNGQVLYSSPMLRVDGIRLREKDGALIVTGRP